MVNGRGRTSPPPNRPVIPFAKPLTKPYTPSLKLAFAVTRTSWPGSACGVASLALEQVSVVAGASGAVQYSTVIGVLRASPDAAFWAKAVTSLGFGRWLHDAGDFVGS